MRSTAGCQLIEKLQDLMRGVNEGLGLDASANLPFLLWRRADPSADTGERFGCSLSLAVSVVRRIRESAVAAAIASVEGSTQQRVAAVASSDDPGARGELVRARARSLLRRAYGGLQASSSRSSALDRFFSCVREALSAMGLRIKVVGGGVASLVTDGDWVFRVFSGWEHEGNQGFFRTIRSTIVRTLNSRDFQALIVADEITIHRKEPPRSATDRQHLVKSHTR
jgi:hypothetical protein